MSRASVSRVPHPLVLQLFLVFSFTGISLAEPQSASQFCQAAKKQTAQKSKIGRVFGFVEKSTEDSAQASLNGNWLEFPDLGTLRKMARGSAIYETAEVWTLPSGILFVSMYLTSSSGDWSNFIDYCYRPNGSLAWMESDYRFLPGEGIRRIRTRVFSLDGKVSSQDIRFIHLSTGKPTTNARLVMDYEDPVYLTPTHLPFTSQLATVYDNQRAH